MARNLEEWLGSHEPIKRSECFSDGDIVGEWKLAGLIGRGGSGEVWRAFGVSDGQCVAIKVLTRTDDLHVSRFERGADFAIGHHGSIRCIPKCFGRGVERGHHYAVFEDLNPIDLPETEGAIAEFACRLCDVVGGLHALRLVHRDIKPSNIMARDDAGRELVLIDLDLLKPVDEESVPNVEVPSIVDGQSVGSGTPGYSAPEQFTGSGTTFAVDVHAIGMVIYECFHQKPPRRWARIIGRAVSSAPGLRYANTSALKRAIRMRYAPMAFIAALGVLVVASVAAVLCLRPTAKRVDVVTGARSQQSLQTVSAMLGRSIGAPQLYWVTGGTAGGWAGADTGAPDGGPFVQSGGSSGGKAESWLKTEIDGEGGMLTLDAQVITYKGKVQITCDDQTLYEFSGIASPTSKWQRLNLPISPGRHALRFTYYHPGVGYVSGPMNGFRLANFKLTH